LRRERDALLACERFVTLDDLVDQLHRIFDLLLDHEPAGVHARDVRQIAEQVLHALGRAPDDLELTLGCRITMCELEHLRGEIDRAEWVAQIM
jgi:hypothetical protein